MKAERSSLDERCKAPRSPDFRTENFHLRHVHLRDVTPPHLRSGGSNMFEILLLSQLGYTPSSGSWTRNMLPDGWKNGSGGNSQ